MGTILVDPLKEIPSLAESFFFTSNFDWTYKTYEIVAQT